jgi:integrase
VYEIPAARPISRRLPSNPIDALPAGKRPGKTPRRITVPTDAQVEALLASAREEARPVLELAAARLRRTELLRLNWADVDLDGREIRVRRAKTDAGERVVPMFGSARRILLEQKARSGSRRPSIRSSLPSSGRPMLRRRGTTETTCTPVGRRTSRTCGCTTSATTRCRS